MPNDPQDRVRALEEEAAAAAAAATAKNEEWLKKQADQLENDGWTDAAARARTQLAETKEAKSAKAAPAPEPKATTKTVAKKAEEK